MEDVLEVYHCQFGDNEVLVCLDETSKQQVKETRQPLPARPGMPACYDYEYERNGVSNLFMLFAPLEGWRRVEVTAQSTAIITPPTIPPISTRIMKSTIRRSMGVGFPFCSPLRLSAVS